MTDNNTPNLSSEGNPSEVSLPILKKIQDENSKLELELARREELRGKLLLSGKSEAGNIQVQEETPAQYRDRMIKGGKRN